MVTYAVAEPGADAPPEVHYGWAHLHALQSMLAREEGIVLETMLDHGGLTPWSPASTPLAPLFVIADGLTPAQCRLLLPRLREISADWTRRSRAEPAAPAMLHDQALSLAELVELLAYGATTGRPIRIT